MSDETDYETFLKEKFKHLPTVGFTDEITLPETMFPHQAVGARWALQRGRAALFFDTGLGKANMGLVWCQHVGTKGLVLLVAPLAVSEQFAQTEAPKFGIPAKIVEQMSDCEAGVVNITNYEKLHRFDLSAFVGVCLDESSILKSLDGKTKEMLIAAFAATPYRLAMSATPSPNDHMELGNHAEFLGIMTRAEMLAMYFTHDGGDTSKWRVKEHAKDAFWAWVASWALMVKKPSDLGFDDAKYNLPALNIHEHVVQMPESYHKEQHTLIPVEARTLTERRAAKKASMSNRVEACAALVNDSKDTWIVWCHLNEEGDRLQKMIPGAIQIAGSDTVDDKKKRMLDFAAGKIRVLITKGKIAGFGMNWQNCHKQAFVGLNESHEQFYQCVRRSWRFGQKFDVDIHLFLSEAETNTLRDLRRKEQSANDMGEAMVKATRAIAHEAVTGASKQSTPYEKNVVRGKHYTFFLGDSCDAIKGISDESIDYTIFSPPFVSLYVFSDSERDMGNCRNNDEFYEHFRYLVREIHRTTKPGRLCSFHCMDLPTLKHREGYIGLIDFGGLLLKAFQDEGWIFHSKVVIDKSPVVQMTRTKAKGLLWKTLRADSTDSRQGLPDYMFTVQKPGESDTPYLGDYANALAGIAEMIEGGPVSLANERALDLYLRMHAEVMPSVMTTMRKRGQNGVPVKHTPEEFPVTRWQRIAAPVWTDIDQSDTLQYRSAKGDGDDKHICVARGTLVLTTDGYKPIQDLQEGQMVLTHMGRWRPIVAKVCNGVRPIIKTTAHGVAGLYTTPDHKIWARRASTTHPRVKAMQTDPEWICAESTLGSYVNLKLPPIEESDLSAEEWWIVGRYLGDGHLTERGMPFISFDGKEKEELLARLGARAGAINKTTTAYQIYVKGNGGKGGHHNDRLHTMIRRCGTGASVKQIPVEGLTLRPDLARALLDGYLSADGHQDDLGRWHACSVSRPLALGMAMVAQRARNSVASVYAGRKAGTCVIQGRAVNTKDEWKFMLSQQNRSAWVAEDGAWKKVRSIALAGEAEVWDIQVAEDASFTAEGCIVHNCPLQCEVVRRGVELYSNPGETVASWFGGIATEGVVALEMGREAVLCELKKSYWKVGARNLAEADGGAKQVGFDFGT